MSISSIGSMSGMAGMQMQGMRQRPDPAQMAENLFDKLDTSGQGYLQKADLQTAFDSLSSSSTSGATANVDEIFAKLDGDSDGKVTKDEFSSSLKKLSEQLDQQFQSMRMQGGMEGMGGGMGGMGAMGAMGGMPPPPPPGGNGGDEGFTKDELSSQLEEIGSSDSQRSSLISSVVENFDAADTDGNGKVSFQEAMAFQQSQATSASGSSSSGTASATGSDTASADAVEAKVMLQIMRLMHAYGQQGESAQASSSISVSA